MFALSRREEGRRGSSFAPVIRAAAVLVKREAAITDAKAPYILNLAIRREQVQVAPCPDGRTGRQLMAVQAKSLETTANTGIHNGLLGYTTNN